MSMLDDLLDSFTTGEADESEEGEDIGDILDEIQSPVTAGEAEESEEGEDIGDILGDIQNSTTLLTSNDTINQENGEAEESEEGEDIGDILGDIHNSTTIITLNDKKEEEEEGEDIGDLGDLVSKPISAESLQTNENLQQKEEEKGKQQQEEQKESQKQIKKNIPRKQHVSPPFSVEIPEDATSKLSAGFLDCYNGSLSKIHETLAEFRLENNFIIDKK